ncbi:MAG: tryptophan-rich sensory protein [Lachnospiraceae bacterium]|nr:tryptophan-rich sensory protein [Lachnospiraceae bacterium]
MRFKPLTFIICIAIPLLVGGLAAFLTSDSMELFEAMNQPPLSPPGILFPIVWSILYTLMGIASYLVITSGNPSGEIQAAMMVYGIQLLFNFLWSIIFFNLEWYWFAFIWLLMLWALIYLTKHLFSMISKTAGYLMVPYLLWVAFAGYLNFGIAILN